MKRLVENYTFNHAAKTVTFNLPDFYNVIPQRILLITDVTTGTVIYRYDKSTLGGTVNTNVLTLDFDTTGNGFNDSDVLQIWYEFPEKGSKLDVIPETRLLMDDNFDDGPAGWQELFQFVTDWNTQRYLPMTLSPHGAFGKYSLKMQTNNANKGVYGGGANIIKRLTHQAQPKVANKGIVKFESWFSFGSDSIQTANGFDSAGPQSLLFMVDSEYPNNTTTDNTGIGRRAFFTCEWQQSLFSSPNQNYTGHWYLSQGSGHNYGDPGYVIPTSVAFFDTGYKTNFPFNQNKKNIQYVAIIVDTYNGNFLGLQANDLFYDLTKIPANGNNPLPSMLAIGDPTYNIAEFLGGLNPLIQMNNVIQTGVATASWFELHRSRVTYL